MVPPLMLVWTILGICLCPAIFLVWKIATHWTNDRIARLLIWVYGRGWLLIMAPFVRFHRFGLKEDQIKPPCILVANHLSFFDIYCMALLPFSNVSMAVRKWPFKMFWFAPFMYLAGYINVESLHWESIYETAFKVLSKGGCVLFFPEGHRSRDGKLQRFYSGAFRLAVETGTKIVPLCISGTNELFPPGRLWLRPTHIAMKALAPVDPTPNTTPNAHLVLKKRVKRIMAESLTETATYGMSDRNVLISADGA